MENAVAFHLSRRNEVELDVVCSILKGRQSGSKWQSSHIEQCVDKRNLCAAYEHQEIGVPIDTRTTFACCFSPDGTLLASSHGDHKIYISRVESLQVIHTLKGHARTPWCLAWHPDPQRRLLASGCLGGVTTVWQLGETVAKESWRPVSMDSLSGKLVSCVAFHPVRQREVVIAMANCILFWDWHMKTPYRLLSTGNPAERISVVKFDPLSRCMITAISNVHTPSLSEVIQTSLNSNEQPANTSSSLRPITIDIINTGQLGPRTQQRQSRLRGQNAATQTDPVAVSVGTSTSSIHHSIRRNKDEKLPPDSNQTLGCSYNLRSRCTSQKDEKSTKKDFKSGHKTAQPEEASTSRRSCSNEEQSMETSSHISGSSKRKTRFPRKAKASRSRSCSRPSKRAKISRSSVGTNTDAQQLNEEPQVESSRSTVAAPSAIRANVYFSDFPNYPSTNTNMGPVFPLSNSDPHGAIFHSHFPRNFVRLQTEPLLQSSVPTRTEVPLNLPTSAEAISNASRRHDIRHGPASTRTDVVDPVGNTVPTSSTTTTDVPTSGTTTREVPASSRDNPADYLRIAVVHCAANQTTSLVSRLQSQATTVPIDDSGYRISVRLHPPIDRDISILSGAYGVRVNSERRSEFEIDPPNRELSAPDLFANRVIDTLRSALNNQPETSASSVDSTAENNTNQPTVVDPEEDQITSESQTSPTSADQSRGSSSETSSSGGAGEASVLPESGTLHSLPSLRRPQRTFTHRVTLGRIVELELGEVTNPQRAHVSRVTREPESFHNLDSIPRTSAMPSQERPSMQIDPNLNSVHSSESDSNSTTRRLATFATSSSNPIGVPSSDSNPLSGGSLTSGRQPTRLPRRTAGNSSRNGVVSTRDVNGTHHIYDISVFDSRLRPNEAIQDAITRVAFGAFAVTGDYMRAQQRVSYRLQYWTDLSFPAIHNPEANVLVKRCKVLNQTALDISKDGSILALLTSNDKYDFEETFLSIYPFDSLSANVKPIAKIPVGHNAISVSLSASSLYVFVGYYNKQSTRSFFFRNFLNGPSLGEIFEFAPKKVFTQRLIPRKQLNQPTVMTNRESRFRGSNEEAVGSVNCACWVPIPGSGLIYGTTLGELIVCAPKRPKIERETTTNSGSGNARVDDTPETADSPSDLLIRLGRDNFELLGVQSDEEEEHTEI